jgi:hypothetical protein
MAKKQIIQYIPTDEEFKAMKICLDNDLAYYIERTKDSSYYVIKYRPSNYKLINYLAIDTKLEATPSNRQTFNEYEGMKKVMDLYKQHSKRF